MSNYQEMRIFIYKNKYALYNMYFNQFFEKIAVLGYGRTAFCKASLKKLTLTATDFVLEQLLKKTLYKYNINPTDIESVIFGNVLSYMGDIIQVRIACLNAGIDKKTQISVVNKLCGSSMESIQLIGNMIRLNDIQLGIAGGFEFMSRHSFSQNYSTSIDFNTFTSEAEKCLIPMGLTAENIATDFNIRRNDVDEYSIQSHLKAFSNSNSKNEIIGIKTKEGIFIDHDDGIRNPDPKKIKGLKACFQVNGITTPASASQISDGASVLVLGSYKYAEDHKIPILGTIIDQVCVGCDPSIMGIGPVYAIKELLLKNNLKKEDISLWEINEAFGVQVLCCIRELNLDIEKVNTAGGALSIGHPLAATGARLVGSILNRLNKEDFGIASICIATGMSIAILLQKH